MWKKVCLWGKVFVLIIHHLGVNLQLWLTSQMHRLTYRSGPNPRNIVIIGGSFAGFQTARYLAKSVPSGYRIIVVEKHSHFHLTWCLPRFSIVDGHDDKAFIPCDRTVGTNNGSCRWIQDTVNSVSIGSVKSSGGQIQTASGETIDYEYLVLAIGANAGLPSRVAPNDKASGLKALKDHRQKIQEAHDIVVIGGGAAGIELAADAKSFYPEKNVSLIHSRKTLFHEGFGTKVHEAVYNGLQELGVNLVLGERPRLPDAASGDIMLSNNDMIHYDYLIKCTGQKPNTDLVQFLSPTSFSASGHVRVKPTLQVADDTFQNIYAAGDVIDFGAIKNARSANEQAQIVSANIVRSIKGKSLKNYQQMWWEGATKITIGKGKSVMYMSDGQAEVTIGTKSEKIELDSAMVWKYLGAKPYIDTSDQV